MEILRRCLPNTPVLGTKDAKTQRSRSRLEQRFAIISRQRQLTRYPRFLFYFHTFRSLMIRFAVTLENHGQYSLSIRQLSSMLSLLARENVKIESRIKIVPDPDHPRGTDAEWEETLRNNRVLEISMEFLGISSGELESPISFSFSFFISAVRDKSSGLTQFPRFARIRFASRWTG